MLRYRARDDIADVLRAHRVEVVDKQGHLVAVLDGDVEAAGLRIYDPQGSERITAAVLEWTLLADGELIEKRPEG